MLQATVVAFTCLLGHFLSVFSLGRVASSKQELTVMFVGCQDHCHLKASVIFTFNIILFVSVHTHVYKFYENSRHSAHFLIKLTTDFVNLYDGLRQRFVPPPK